MVKTRPWLVFKCCIRSRVTGRFGQYGQTTRGEPTTTPLAPAPGVAASVALVCEGDAAPDAGKAEGRGLGDAP